MHPGLASPGLLFEHRSEVIAHGVGSQGGGVACVGAPLLPGLRPFGSETLHWSVSGKLPHPILAKPCAAWITHRCPCRPRWNWPRERNCLPDRVCRAALVRMARTPLACLHVCLFACPAACLPLPVTGSVGRGHGELPPFRQDDQTQRRAIRHGGGGLSVGLRHRMRPGRAHARLHRQARSRGLLHSRPR